MLKDHFSACMKILPHFKLWLSFIQTLLTNFLFQVYFVAGSLTNFSVLLFSIYILDCSILPSCSFNTLLFFSIFSPNSLIISEWNSYFFLHLFRVSHIPGRRTVYEIISIIVFLHKITSLCPLIFLRKSLIRNLLA